MKVIVVDDTRINLTLMQHLIKRLDDAEALLFEQSAEALQWCIDNDPDLIVVDYMMPSPDGLEFIERFRAAPEKQDIPVLMVTANNDNEVRYKALDVGANDFLTKPIDNKEFLARARNMLALRRSQKALNDRAAWLAEEVHKATLEIKRGEQETILRLTRAAEFRDPETGAHIQRMALYSQLIARKLGWSAIEQELILASAPMHDVGKVGIPDQILLKPGRLDDQELEIMRKHAQYGHDILHGSQSPLLQMGAIIALTHHEKYDGSGYPNMLKGEDIPQVGRIVAVADVFDALMSERPYKKAWPLEQALDFLKAQRGQHFDPACLDAFFDSWEAINEVRIRLQDRL
ncbi:putative two-component system response regulator [Chitinivorax tropicus]|uniref:Putative two-component system response regulator n=1 Tax=Chitinivorax tropicus TaxID=714531 RepID=A0A840MRX1_9PROT|nr:HD domain-containing phosphohydrolase [Chitinivorax tropicus]MBB5019003.1 putative two-component system response regulator [Chitinivorax tropicus]